VYALASVTGDVDLSNEDGPFMARILGAVARKESDDKSDASSEEQALTRRLIAAESLT
jgi:DNA invertase Pin-like site-specific DNA recombinase